MQVTLKVISGKHTGKEFTYDQHDTLILGRDKNNVHVWIDHDQAVSRNHFILEINPPRCFIRDLNSSNGTFVNDVCIKETMLKHKDVIEAGETKILVLIYEDSTVALLPATLLRPNKKQSELSELPPSPAVRQLKQIDFAQQPVQPGRQDHIPGKIARQVEDPSALKLQEQAAKHLPPANRLQKNARVNSEVADAIKNPPPNNPGLPDLQVPGYRLVKFLSKGGMGAVYAGEQLGTKQPVAIKVVLPDIAMREDVRKMFLREVEVMAKLRHDALVQLLDYGSVKEVDYYVMDLIKGVNLAELVHDCKGQIPVPAAVNIVMQVLDGLQYAHLKGVVHRDLKPGNIMVESKGNQWRTRVLDFGMAKCYETAGSLSNTGDVKGTLFYMPPEQILNCRGVGPRSDLFSIGAVLYFLFCGHHIYDYEGNNTAELLNHILDNKIVPLSKRNPRIPKGLVEVVTKALSRKMERRYGSAAEMKHALEIAPM